MSAQAVQAEKFAVVSNPGTAPESKHEPFEAKLLEEARKYYYLTQSSRARRYVIQSTQDLMAKGIHFVDYDPKEATFTEWDQKTLRDLMYTPTPRFQAHVETIAARYSSSDPKPEVLSPATDTKTRTVIRQAQDYADYLDWRFYRADPKARQTECKIIPLRGVFTYLDYDYTKGKEYQIPQMQGQEKGYCQDCGVQVGGQGEANGEQTGQVPVLAGTSQPGGVAGEIQQPQEGSRIQPTGQGMDACPACGSPNIQTVMGLSVAGQHTAHEGEVCKYTYDAFQVEIFDRRRGIEESPYLIVDEICFKTELLKQYPWLNGIEGNAMLGHWSTGYIGLHYLQQLEIMVANSGRIDQSKDAWNPSTSGYSTGYAGAYLSDLMSWKRRVFLDAGVYEKWPALEKDTQIPGFPHPIPKGTRPIDVWPAGLCYHIINNSKIVKTENINKNERWTMTDYRPASSGLHGSGVASLVSQQKLLDEVTSYQVYALFAAGHGITVKDSRVQESDGVPGHCYELEPDARQMDEPIGNFIEHFDIGGGQALAGSQGLKQDIVASMGDLAMASPPASSNLIPASDRTATASNIQKGVVDVLTAPPLELYAGTRAKVLQQAFGLEGKYALRKKSYTKYGETAQRWFDPMKMPEDIRIVPAADSWHPRTMDTRRQNISAAMGMGLQTPEVMDEAMQVFGLSDIADTYADWAVKGEKRLDALKASAGQVEQESQMFESAVSQMRPEHVDADPDTAEQLLAYNPVERLIEQAQAAPRPMDNNGAFVRFYEEVYLRDEFDEYPPLLQQAIEQLWAGHQQAEAMKQQAQTGLALAAKQPLRDAAKQDQAEASEQETAKQEASEGAQGEQAEAAARRAEQSKQADHGRAMEMQGMKHQQTLAVERVRAKTKGAK